MADDSSEPSTPVPAVAVPSRAGQLSAHWPLQADLSPWSLVKAYSVRPSPSTRMSPSLPSLATATVVPPAAGSAVVAGAAVVAGSAGAAVPDPPSSLPPQAASTRASTNSHAAPANVFLMNQASWA